MRQILVSLTLGLLFVITPVGRAEEPDSKYMRIYSTIEKADAMAKAGQLSEARIKYQEAQAGLRDLKAINPNWNSKAVSYRLNYVTEKIDELSRPRSVTTPDGAVGSTSAKPGALPAGLQVKLLSAGDEPRAVLRLQAKPGEAQSAVMTVQMTVGMGGAAGMMKMPPMSFTLNVEPKSVTAEGDIAVETRVDAVTVGADADGGPPMADALKAALSGIDGMTIASTISDRGFSRKSEARIPAQTDAAGRQVMEQIKDSLLHTHFVLPEEPVGPGAKWEVKQKLNTQGMTIEQTSALHLISQDGTVLTLESSITQSAGRQKVANPAMPQMKVDLTRMTGDGKAQLTVDLGKLIPTQATVTGNTEMVLSMGAGGQVQDMTMQSETTIKIEAK